MANEENINNGDIPFVRKQLETETIQDYINYLGQYCYNLLEPETSSKGSNETDEEHNANLEQNHKTKLAMILGFMILVLQKELSNDEIDLAELLEKIIDSTDWKEKKEAAEKAAKEKAKKEKKEKKANAKKAKKAEKIEAKKNRPTLAQKFYANKIVRKFVKLSRKIKLKYYEFLEERYENKIEKLARKESRVVAAKSRMYVSQRKLKEKTKTTNTAKPQVETNLGDLTSTTISDTKEEVKASVAPQAEINLDELTPTIIDDISTEFDLEGLTEKIIDNANADEKKPVEPEINLDLLNPIQIEEVNNTNNKQIKKLNMMKEAVLFYQKLVEENLKEKEIANVDLGEPAGELDIYKRSQSDIQHSKRIVNK